IQQCHEGEASNNPRYEVGNEQSRLVYFDESTAQLEEHQGESNRDERPKHNKYTIVQNRISEHTPQHVAIKQKLKISEPGPGTVPNTEIVFVVFKGEQQSI